MHLFLWQAIEHTKKIIGIWTTNCFLEVRGTQGGQVGVSTKASWRTIVEFYVNTMSIQSNYPSLNQGMFEDPFPFPLVGYGSSVERRFLAEDLLRFHLKRVRSPAFFVSETSSRS